MCKERFTKIERVNPPRSRGGGKRKRGGGVGGGCASESGNGGEAGAEGGGVRSKRVRTRDQRSDFNFANPLQGIFGELPWII